ncbi:sensor histidine kinase [Parasphingopyxis sp. CP4]|uniref:sensor histidine kinase n=1 Tax=Parasphingopyxis sp. CP4 TaxID=2724527 RepID=UPI0015A05CE5|nr:sensor histidine kinase [Parasphingopyxis sp. CP4]QLC20719.1 sensor histidine kinase [Parasphingopyxis sp. CP4]
MSEASPSPEQRIHLPTGLKTLLLLGLALLPLGIVAISASLDQARDAEEARLAEVELVADIGARHLASAIDNAREGLRSILVDHTSDASFNCEKDAILNIGSAAQETQIAILGRDGTDICAVPDLPPASIAAEIGPEESAVIADREAERLIVIQRSADGASFAAIALTRASLALLPQPALLDRNYHVTLTSDDAIFTVRPLADPDSERDMVTAERQVGETDLRLSASFARRPLTNSERFSIALPILAWTFGALLGWFAIGRLLLNPLAQLRKAVIQHADGDGEFALSHSAISATEIQQLGQAFEKAFASLRTHETQLAEGLTEQTRLTREVHHRVKNNLQIIASLLSLHARAAKSDDSAAAYASIQRRVDALAIVQRNLFAELETDAGLPLRPIIAELASGLQHSAPETSRISIAADIDPVQVGQDIAAPVAFLITELVELAMLSSDQADIAITITAAEPKGAKLTVHCLALQQASERAEFARYRRVLTGLSRQLQAPLAEEDAGAAFTIVIPTL